MNPRADSPPFVHHSVPNRSLGHQGRRVFLAFRVLAAHDGDFEHLEIGAGEVKVDSRCARSVTHAVFHQPWARVVMKECGERCTLGLAYAGRTVPIGRLMSDEGRRDLARRLRGRIAVTAS